MNIAIIGGGNLGLSMADELSKYYCNIKIFEAASKIGGLASTFKVKWGNKTYNFPSTYRHFELSKVNSKIIDSLKLNNKTVYKIPTGGLLYDGHDIKHGFMGIPLLLLQKNIPLSTKIKASLLLLQNFRPGIKPVKLGYFKGGHETFMQKLEKKLLKNNSTILKSTNIQKIDFDEKEITYKKNNKQHKEKFGMIISTISPDKIASLAEGSLPSEISGPLRKIKYGHVTTLCVGLNIGLKSPYLQHIRDKSYPFSELFNSTMLTDLPANKSFLYVVSYDTKLHNLKEKEITDLFKKHLERFFKSDIKKHIAWTKLFKHKTWRTSPVIISVPMLSEKLINYKGNYIIYHDFKQGVFMNFKRTLGNFSKSTPKLQTILGLTPYPQDVGAFGLLSYPGYLMSKQIARVNHLIKKRMF